MYKFWYDYVTPKYGEKAKLCYMDTDSFTIYMKTEDIYDGTAKDVEPRFDTQMINLKKYYLEEKIKLLD